MSASQCGRCGRPRPDASSTSETARSIPYPPFEGEGPWASFDGRDTCPSCQTAEERRQAAHRIAEAIELEIERRQAQGHAPDVYEAAMVAYAMALRAGGHSIHPPGDGTGEEQTSSPRRDAYEDSTLDGRNYEETPGVGAPRLQVAFTGAFLTDPPLAVRIDGYSNIQGKLASRLVWPQWTTNDLRARDGTYLGEGGGGFTESLPLIIIRRQGHDLLPQLTSALTGMGCLGDPLKEFSPIVVARPMTLGIDFYDLGVAVITAWFDVIAATGAQYADTAEAIKKLAGLRATGGHVSPLAEALQSIATATTSQYREAIRYAAPVDLLATWLSGDADADGTSAGPSQDGGRLLWLHPVSVVCAKEPDECATRVRELAPPFRKHIRVDGGMFTAGIGSSAVVVKPDSKDQLAAVRLTELHWAYYALYMQFDRGLLRVLNRKRWTQRAQLQELEDDADRIFADYLRVMDARARLDTDLISRGGDDMAIWSTISEVQHFKDIVEAVDTKLAVLRKLAERRVEQATERRNFLITVGLTSIALLTFVTVTLALWGSWAPRKDHVETRLLGFPVWDLRLWSGLGMLLLAILLGGVITRRLLRRPRRVRQRVAGDVHDVPHNGA